MLVRNSIHDRADLLVVRDKQAVVRQRPHSEITELPKRFGCASDLASFRILARPFCGLDQANE
jgi:hypothetical protein